MQGITSLCDETGGTSLSDVISRASQSSRRLLLPAPATTCRAVLAKPHRAPRSKKDKHNNGLVPTAVVKEESPVDDGRLSMMDDNGEDEENSSSAAPSLVRYVTLASGEVKNESSTTDEREEDRPTKGPAISTAKRK